MTYTTIGILDGTCGHRHKTIEQAERCRIKYLTINQLSDRCVRHVTPDGKIELLTVQESIEANRVHDKIWRQS